MKKELSEKKKAALEKVKGNLKPIQKGEVRNPKGRGKGVKDRATILRQFLELELKNAEGDNVSNPFDKKQTSITIEEAIIAALIKRGLKGSERAIENILDNVYGKQESKVKITETPTIIRDDIPNGS